MKKGLRDRIRKMFDGKCAYCGNDLPEKGWHVDHHEPIFRGWEKRPDRAGDDVEENMMPSCARCNLRKRTLTIEQFRAEIEAQTERLRKHNNQYRLASDYGLIVETGVKVRFHFEKSNVTGERQETNTGDRTMTELEKAIKILTNLKSERVSCTTPAAGWMKTSIEDGLPPTNKTFRESDAVLCWEVGIYDPFVGWYSEKANAWRVMHYDAPSRDKEVTHWMFLPETSND